MSDLIFRIEQEISVDTSKIVYKYNKLGIRFYIIINETNKFRYLYITTKKLYVNTELKEYELDFIKHNNFNEPIYLKKFKNKFNDEFILHNKKHSQLFFIPNEIIIKEIYIPDEIEPKKKYVFKGTIHNTKIVFDNPIWEQKILKKLNIKDIKKRLFKDILNGAKIDNRVKKILITEFFELEQLFDEENNISKDYMKNNSHTIILSQGSTGKSSILSMLGNDLTTTSNAGMFGYYDVVNGSWINGEVSKTKSPILVDEVNEIVKSNVKKGESILSSLNTPLENGKYSYGKAGGKKIYFGNQFIFLGNIEENFNFETLINGLSSNQSTMGRRFCYLVYDDKLEYQQGGERNITKHIKKINSIKKILSDTLYFYLSQKKFFNNQVLKNKKFMKKINDYQKQLSQMIKLIEFENTRQFLDTFIKYSLINRLPIMALKLSLFENISLILDTKDINKLQNSIIIDEMYKQYDLLIGDIKITINNIISHQDTLEIKNNINEIKFNNLNKNLSLGLINLYFKIGFNLNQLNQISIEYNQLKHKGKIKYLIRDILNGKTNSYNKLNIYGLFTIVKNDKINFRINKELFNQYYELLIVKFKDKLIEYDNSNKIIFDEIENNSNITPEIIDLDNNDTQIEVLNELDDDIL